MEDKPQSKSHKKSWLKWLGMILCAILLLMIGFHWGRKSYQSKLIAVKYIDGKYGEAFYCVEVIGQEHDREVEVFARILIGGLDSGYYHDCGKIGTASDLTTARQIFGDIHIDGEKLFIGENFSFEKSQYENHR